MLLMIVINFTKMGLGTYMCVHLHIAYPVLSSSSLASLSLQANSSLKAASCCVLKVLFCFLCTSRYDSSVYMGFIYLCIEDGHTGNSDECQAGDGGVKL